MNRKWKWTVGLTRIMLLIFIPILTWELLRTPAVDRFSGLGVLFPAWMVLMGLVLLIIFGLSEEE